MTDNAKPIISDEIIAKWQKTTNLLARTMQVPAGLIMRVHPHDIEVFVSSETENNPYTAGAKEHLNSGLYCETVMSQRAQLLVPDALSDPEWENNPDIKLNMISYLGFPLIWSDGEIFGTICVLDNKANAYSDEHIMLVEQFADIVTGHLRLLEEIDKRQQAEEQLRQHQANLQAEIEVKTVDLDRELQHRTKSEETIATLSLAVEQSPVSVVITDIDGNIQYVNPKFTQISGYSFEEVTGGNPRILKSGYTSSEEYQELWDMITSGQEWHGEFHNKRKNGELYWESASISPMRNSDGEITHFVGVKEDITERKNAEHALQSSEERFRLVFETSPDAININHLEDGTYIDTNNGFTAIMGYTKDDVIGKTSQQLNIWKNEDDRNVMVRCLQKQGYCENLEAEFVAKDGSIHVGLMSARVIVLDNVPCVISLTRDISEYKRLEAKAKKAELLRIELEKERELVALKDRILSIMSHDFRTPLAIIQTSSDLLYNYFDKMAVDRRSQTLHQIQEQVATLNRMIDDILIVGRSKAGVIDVRQSEIELVQYSRLLFDQIQLADETAHDFEFFSDVAELKIQADGNLLQHILTNLLSNAIKYSPQQSKIVFKIECVESNVIITVSDEGIGIPEADKASLFEPFHRAGNVGEVKGTGLGLSIVKQYVELHDGNIEVESAVGQGSTFKVTFPTMATHAHNL